MLISVGRRNEIVRVADASSVISAAQSKPGCQDTPSRSEGSARAFAPTSTSSRPALARTWVSSAVTLAAVSSVPSGPGTRRSPSRLSRVVASEPPSLRRGVSATPSASPASRVDESSEPTRPGATSSSSTWPAPASVK